MRTGIPNIVENEHVDPEQVAGEGAGNYMVKLPGVTANDTM